MPKPNKKRNRPSSYRRHTQSSKRLVLEYYQRPFLTFQAEMKQIGYNVDSPHDIRKRFWSLVPHRVYDSIEARTWLLSYLQNTLEPALANVIKQHSLAYWLHLYRRLAPGASGRDKDPGTIMLVRAALEAAIQKYASLEPCNGVGISGEVPMSAILGGLLLHPEFELERSIVQTRSQLVLTQFRHIELMEFYQLEKLAYEVWRTEALLRIVGKGASLIVDDSAESIHDDRSDELDKLVRIYDERESGLLSVYTSATGVTYNVASKGGAILLPTYNVHRVSTSDLKEMLEIYGYKMKYPIEFNFLWLPFNIRQYRTAHLPFANAFREHYGIELDTVLLVIAALCMRVLHIWNNPTAKGMLIHHFQRAYEGPYTREYVWEEIDGFRSLGGQVLGLDDSDVQHMDIEVGIEFLQLDTARRGDVDIAYSGPHSVFLPYGQDRWFVDYTWIFRRLYDFFVGLAPSDQSFKGDALEQVVRTTGSVLPVKACKALDGTQRQIDAAFSLGERLVIVECKAAGRSIGFDRGNPDAIEFRKRLIQTALGEVDEKAKWLAKHPLGANYDVRQYREILPVGITPFVEYIPQLQSYYWLEDSLPRVLTPHEFKKALEAGVLASVKNNIVLNKNG